MRIKTLFTSLIFSVLTLCFVDAAAVEHPVRRLVAPTPPMGWNSWNLFEDAINETLICEIADAMVASGMKEAGYQYVCIDDCWHIRLDGGTSGRDDDGVLIPDPGKFPNGMKAIGDYLHGLGLKFGLYTCPGTHTCQGRTASRGHEKKDIDTFASWGVDYIKLDFCGTKDPLIDEGILMCWRALLDQTPRPMVLSVNTESWDYAMVRRYADLWRTTGDISAMWDALPGRTRRNEVCMIIRKQQSLYEYQSPGRWCDSDMLEVGNGNFSDDLQQRLQFDKNHGSYNILEVIDKDLTEQENRAHFSMWAMMSAPLITSLDVRIISESVRRILTNREIIALDQDPAGLMARKVREDRTGIQVWTKRLQAYATQAAALLNMTDQAAKITLLWKDLGINGKAHLRDLWRHEDLGIFSDCLSAVVPAHGVMVLKVTAYEDLSPYPVPSAIPAEGLILEAEDHLGYNVVAFDVPGYSGAGYVRGNDGMSVYWFFDSAEAGQALLHVRYANPASQTNTFQIGLPGTPMQSIAFLPTGSNPNWQTVSVPYTLQKGSNRICIRSGSNPQNEVIIDYLKVLLEN